MDSPLSHQGALTRTVHTELLLDATPEAVWAAVTDFSGYAEWNPVLTHAEGDTRVGSTVHLRLRFGLTVPLRCEVDTCEPGRRLRWFGGVAGMMRGYHYFDLQEAADGGTRLLHGESFSGILVPFVWPFITSKIDAAYADMNAALAARLQR